MMQTSSLPQEIAAPVVTATVAPKKAVPARCAELAAMPFSSLLYRVLVAEQSPAA